MTQVKIFMFFGDFEWVLQPKMGFWDVLEHGNVLTNLIMHLKNIFTKNTRKKYYESLCHSLQMNHFLRSLDNKNEFKSPNYSKY